MSPNHHHDLTSSSSDGASIIKKGLLALGITASTSLISYLAFKYFQSSNNNTNSNNNTDNNNTSSTTTSKPKIKIYKIDDESNYQDWLLFENAKLGLSFKYPSNYTAVLNNSTHLNQIQLIDNNNKESPVIILISIEENIMNFDSIEYSQQNLELLQQQSVGNINILQQEMFQLSNGLPGIEISFDINSNNTIKAYIASISQEFKCYMVQHLVSLGSGTIHDFNINLIRNILKTLKITKPTIYGKAILKKDGIEMLLPSLFYAFKNNLSIVRYHKDDIVKEIKLLNMGNNFDKLNYIKKGKLMQTSLTICGQLCEIINYIDDNNFEYLDLIFNYLNNFYILNCKCKKELFNDFKSEAITTAMSLKFINNNLIIDENENNENNELNLLEQMGMINYENSEFNFKITVPSNQMIHQFSHQEPVVSFVTNTNELNDNLNNSNSNTNNNINKIIEYLNKLTLETMVSVQPIPLNVKNIQDVKETSLQLLEHSSIQIIDSYIHKLNNGNECFTSTYTMNTSDPSFTFMVSSLLANNMVYSISTYTISKSFNTNVEQLFKQIHQSFNFIK